MFLRLIPDFTKFNGIIAQILLSKMRWNQLNVNKKRPLVLQ